MNLIQAFCMKPAIKDIFTYHAPNSEQKAKYDRLTNAFYELALLVDELCPDSREKSLAITNLQISKMFANASIAINER